MNGNSNGSGRSLEAPTDCRLQQVQGIWLFAPTNLSHGTTTPAFPVTDSDIRLTRDSSPLRIQV